MIVADELMARAREALLSMAEPINRPAISRALDTARGSQALGNIARVFDATITIAGTWNGLPSSSLEVAKAFITCAGATEDFARIVASILLEQERAAGTVQ